MNKDEFILLITRYREGNASELEEQLLINYFSSFQQSWDEEAFGSKAASVSRIKEQLLTKINKEGTIVPIKPVHKVHFFRRFRWAAAAVFVLLSGMLYYTWLSKFQFDEHNEIAASAIAPGRDGAKLKLSDGRILLIDSLADGLIATDGNISVFKENGKIVYHGKDDAIVYNEIITDKGRQWSAQLPDGTLVWINAASQLRYPTTFTGSARIVKLEGEAYFEVSKNPNQTFIVQTRTDQIEVLGTHFNINAYSDEGEVKTTLAEGKVKIGSVILRPGQQHQSGILKDVDVGEVIAWKDGRMVYHDVALDGILRAISRWYDVEIEMKGNLGQQSFYFEVSRKATLNELVKVLELNGLSCRIDVAEKKLIVQSK